MIPAPRIPKPIKWGMVVILTVAFFFFAGTNLIFTWDAIPKGIEHALEQALSDQGIDVEIAGIKPGLGNSIRLTGVRLLFPGQIGEVTFEETVVYYSWVKLFTNLNQPEAALSGLRLIEPELHADAAKIGELVQHFSGTGSSASLDQVTIIVDNARLTLTNLPETSSEQPQWLDLLIKAIGYDPETRLLEAQGINARVHQAQSGLVTLTASLVPSGTNLTRLDIQGRYVRDGGWEMKVSTDNADISGVADIATQYLPDLRLQDGSISATAYLQQPKNQTGLEWSADLWLHRIDGHFASKEISFENLQGGARLSPDSLQIMSARAVVDGDPLEVSGSFNLANFGGLDLRVRGDRISLGRHSHLLKEFLPASAITGVEGTVSLDLTVAGTLQHPLLAGSVFLQDVQAQLAQAAPVEVQKITGELQFAGDRIWTEGTSLHLAEQPLELRGQVLLGKTPYFDVNLATEKVGLAAVASWLKQHGLIGLVPKSLRPGSNAPVEGDLSFTGTVIGEPSTPLIAGILQLEQGSVYGIPVEFLNAEFDYALGAFNIRNVDLALPEGQNLQGSAMANLGPGQGEYSGVFRYKQVSLDWLAQYLPNFPAQFSEIQGKASGELAVKGHLGQSGLPDVLNGNLTIADLNLQGYTIPGLKGDWSWKQGQMAVNYFEAVGTYGSVTGHGTYTPDTGLVKGRLFGHDLDLAEAWDELRRHGIVLDSHDNLGGTVSFQAEIGGSVSDPQLAGSVVVTDPAWQNEQFDLFTGSFLYTDDHLAVEKAELTQGLSLVSVTGQINQVMTKPQVYFDTVIREIDADKIGSFLGSSIPLSGSVEAKLSVSGFWPELQAKGPVTLVDGQIDGLAVEGGRAQLFYKPGLLQVTGVSGTVAGTPVSGSLRLAGSKLEGAFEVTEANLNLLDKVGLNPQGVRGKVSLSGVVSGTLDDAVIEAGLQGHSLRWNQYRLDKADGKVQYRVGQGKLVLDALRLYQGDSAVGIKGNLILSPEPRYDLGITIDHVAIADLKQIAPDLNWPRVGGRLSGFSQVSGEGSQVTARATLQGQDLDYAGFTADGRFDLAYKDGLIDVYQGELWDDTGEVQFSGLYSIGGEMNFTAQGGGVKISPIVNLFRPGLDVSGLADFSLSLSGQPGAPEGQMGFEISDGMAEGVAIDNCDGQLELSSKGVTIQEIAVTTGANKTIIQGTIPWSEQIAARFPNSDGTQDRLNLRVKMADESLALLSLIAGTPLDIQGKGRIDLTMTGSLDNPAIDGVIDLTDLHLALPGVLPGSFTEVSAKIDFQGREGVIRQAAGLYNGGEFDLQGKVNFAELKSADVDLALKGTRMGLQFSFMDARADADLTITGPLKTPLIKGTAVLSDAVFTFGQRRKGGGRPYTSEALLDLKVTNRNDVRILYADIVDARAVGEVTVGGTIKNVAITGSAEATRGTISYVGTTFRITSGSADFSAFRGVIPVLQAQAETNVPDAVVQLVVSGPTNDLQLNLSSNPAMSEQEIVSKLSLPGRLNQLLQGAKDGMWGEELIRLVDDELSSQVMGGIESVVRQALQLDEFRIRRAFSEENVQLQFGKYLVDNLYVTYTRTLDTNSPLEYLGFEYRIQPNVTVNNSISSDGEVRFGLETKLRF